MNFNEDNHAAGKDNQQQETNKIQPTATLVDDGTGLDEKDLKKSFLFGINDTQTPTEGKAAGGQNFGGENLTPAANDKNNPTQMAGHTNAYFDRNEPSEEHPEDSNFTAKHQEGAPDYSKAQAANATEPKPDEVKRGDGENDRPHPQQPYTEGTDDSDGTNGPNIPGPGELPDQQKVGEDDHIES